MKCIICLSLIVVLGLLGCEKNVDFDIPFEGEKLAVYGMLTNDATSDLKVYRTVPVLESNPNVILDNIEAKLLENGEPIADFNFNNSDGTLAISSLDKNALYSIEVNVDGQQIKSEEIQITTPIPIQNIVYEVNSDSSKVDVKFSFNDPGDETNYYVYEVIQKFEDGYLESKESRSMIDENFNGINKEVIFESKMEDLILGDNYELIGNLRLEEIMIKLYHVTEHYFHFIKSDAENSGELGNQFSEQNPLWTNIIGGYGYLGAYSIDSVKIVF